MQWRTNLWFLCAGTFIGNISFTMIVPFLPLYLTELGLQENVSLWSGFIISIAFLTYALMAPVWGSLADRYGKRVMLLRSGLGVTISIVLMGFAANHWQLFFLRGLHGLLSGFIPAAVMMVASNTPQAEMGYALGMVNSFIAIGSITGPFFGGLFLQFVNLRGIFFIAAGLLGLATVLAVAGTKEKVSKQTEKMSVRKDLAMVMRNRSLVVYFFCLGMVYIALTMLQPTLPLFIAELSPDNSEMATGVVYSIIGISMAIGSFYIGRIRNISYILVLLYGLVLCGVFSILQGLTYSVLLLGAERFLFGFANAAVNVSANVLITECTDESMRGRVFGTLNGWTAIGAVFGPLIGGGLGERFGNASSFYGSALVLFIAALAVWRLYRGKTDSKSKTCEEGL